MSRVGYVLLVLLVCVSCFPVGDAQCSCSLGSGCTTLTLETGVITRLTKGGGECPAGKTMAVTNLRYKVLDTKKAVVVTSNHDTYVEAISWAFTSCSRDTATQCFSSDALCGTYPERSVYVYFHCEDYASCTVQYDMDFECIPNPSPSKSISRTRSKTSTKSKTRSRTSTKSKTKSISRSKSITSSISTTKSITSSISTTKSVNASNSVSPSQSASISMDSATAPIDNNKSGADSSNADLIVIIVVLVVVLFVGAITAWCMLRSRRLSYEEWGARKHMAGKFTHPAHAAIARANVAANPIQFNAGVPAGMGGGAVMANGQAIALDDIAVYEQKQSGPPMAARV